MDFTSLKSGTDIRGIASALGGNKVTLTKDAVYSITCAFVIWYTNKFSKRPCELVIALGRDSRITSKNFSVLVKKALTSSGATVLDCGLCSTPAMFMTTIDLKVDASIEITASHHPFDHNGLKFFSPAGALDSYEISEIINIANRFQKFVADYSGEIIKIDYMKFYASKLRRVICAGLNKREVDLPLKNYKIIVDAGNGVGGFYAINVLKKLGADISGSRFLEPDGMFPNHTPNPEDPIAMKSICEAVTENNAHLGIIFDTDVDRVACVGTDGEPINKNRLIALAAYIATEGRKKSVIVTDSVTSDGIKEFIEQNLDCIHYRYQRGYKNVINKAKELSKKGFDCPLAIETSGHAAFKENFFLDDGAYLATKIIIEFAKKTNFSEVLNPLRMPIEEKEIRFNITDQNYKKYGLKIIDEFTEFIASKKEYSIADDNHEGIRVCTPNGWFLLRMSVHDPVMPMNFESNVKGGIEKDIADIKDFFSKFNNLDISAFN